MKRWLYLLGLLLLNLLSFATPSAVAALPATLPGDTEITYLSEGGIAPRLFRIDIRGTSMVISDQPGGQRPKIWRAQLTSVELGKLHRAFIENEFDTIRPSTPIIIPDGKSRSMELRFQQQKYYAIVGDGIRSAPGHAERFQKIDAALGQLVKKYRK